MYKSINGQQWDTMLMTYRRTGVNGEIMKPFLIFIDFKSKRVIKESKQSTIKHLKLTQYQHVNNLVEELVDKLKKKKKSGGDSDVSHRPPPLTLQSQALINGDYIYIYLTTYPLVKLLKTSISNDYTEDLLRGNLYITDEAEAKKFFGILFPFYETASRAAIDSVPEKASSSSMMIIKMIITIIIIIMMIILLMFIITQILFVTHN